MFLNPIFKHFDLVGYGVLFFTALTFISSLGLLKRKNWARIIFISMLVLAIIWRVAVLLLQQYWLNLVLTHDNSFHKSFETSDVILSISWLSIGIGIITFFGWIIKKLTTQPIVGEFVVIRKNNFEH